MMRLIPVVLVCLLVVGCAPLRAQIHDAAPSGLVPVWTPSIGWAKCIEIDDARLRAGSVAVGAGVAGTAGGGLATLLGAFDEKTARMIGGVSLLTLGVTVAVAKYLETQETQRFANYCVAPHVEKSSASETHDVR